VSVPSVLLTVQSAVALLPMQGRPQSCKQQSPLTSGTTRAPGFPLLAPCGACSTGPCSGEPCCLLGSLHRIWALLMGRKGPCQGRGLGGEAVMEKEESRLRAGGRGA
jgi:hypothetical protein